MPTSIERYPRLASAEYILIGAPMAAFVGFAAYTLVTASASLPLTAIAAIIAVASTFALAGICLGVSAYHCWRPVPDHGRQNLRYLVRPGDMSACTTYVQQALEALGYQCYSSPHGDATRIEGRRKRPLRPATGVVLDLRVGPRADEIEVAGYVELQTDGDIWIPFYVEQHTERVYSALI